MNPFVNFRRQVNDAQENKELLRAELQRDMDEFEKKGGSITVLPPGATHYEGCGLTLDAGGMPLSGFNGVVWHREKAQWQVLAGKKFGKPVGYADDIASALKMQRQFNAKLTTKMKMG